MNEQKTKLHRRFIMVPLAAVTMMAGFLLANPASAVAADARPCNPAEQPAQVRLVLGPGAVICFGGTVGVVDVDDFTAQGFASGGYTASVALADDEVIRLQPNEFANLEGRTVVLVSIDFARPSNSSPPAYELQKISAS